MHDRKLDRLFVILDNRLLDHSPDTTCAHADIQAWGVGSMRPFLTNHINMWRIYFLAVEIVTDGKSYEQTRQASFHAQRIVKHLGIDPTSPDLWDI